MSHKDQAFVILIPAFPENEMDTNWVPAQQIFVRNLKEIYPLLNVFVLSFHYPQFKSRFNFYDAQIQTYGGSKGKFLKPWIWLQVWNDLEKIRKEFNMIGMLSFWHGECALVGSWYGKIKKIKHHSWLMGQDAKRNNPWARWIDSNEEEIIAISDFTQKEFYKNHKIKPKNVIPLGIDPGQFEPVNQEKSIDIIGVGSLIPLKRYENFIEIIRELVTHFPELKSCICGAGPEMEILKQKIKAYSLENHIQVLGLLERPKVLSLMGKSKVLLHTAEYEGFGLVILEALFAGSRVISLVKPMNEDIQNWQIAMDHQDVILKLKSILNNKSLVSSSVLPYTMENSVKRILDLYDFKSSAIF